MTPDEIIESLFKDDLIRSRKFENKIRKAFTTHSAHLVERLRGVKIYNCMNTTTIFDTKDYVLKSDFDQAINTTKDN